VRVAGDEQVVRALGDGGAHHPPLGRMQVLGFVDDDVVDAVFGGLRSEQVRRSRADLQVRRPSRGAQLGREVLHGLPELFALPSAQRRTSAASLDP
jgi:hypothetical protein